MQGAPPKTVRRLYGEAAQRRMRLWEDCYRWQFPAGRSLL